MLRSVMLMRICEVRCSFFFFEIYANLSNAFIKPHLHGGFPNIEAKKHLLVPCFIISARLWSFYIIRSFFFDCCLLPILRFSPSGKYGLCYSREKPYRSSRASVLFTHLWWLSSYLGVIDDTLFSSIVSGFWTPQTETGCSKKKKKKKKKNGWKLRNERERKKKGRQFER